MSTNELMTCPFCHSKEVKVTLTEDGNHCGKCLNCYAEGPEEDTIEDASDSWNRRAPPACPPINKAVEELRAVTDERDSLQAQVGQMRAALLSAKARIECDHQGLKGLLTFVGALVIREIDQALSTPAPSVAKEVEKLKDHIDTQKVCLKAWESEALASRAKLTAAQARIQLLEEAMKDAGDSITDAHGWLCGSCSDKVFIAVIHLREAKASLTRETAQPKMTAENSPSNCSQK